MGRRGVSYHLRGTHAPHHLGRAGVPIAILATNRSWVSFAPLGKPPATLAPQLDAPVVTVWSDDDAGAVLSVEAPDGWDAEMTITIEDTVPTKRARSGKLTAAHTPITEADEAFLDELVKRKILTGRQQIALVMKLRLSAKMRASWLARDGLEKLLGVPARDPLPSPLTPRLQQQLAPRATIVQPAKRATKPAASAKRRATAKPAPTVKAPPIDPKELALHIHYWSELFQMNTWSLANRYKKHLPAERRREVETLLGYVAMGSEPGDIERSVTAILGTIWAADDWAAAIRDPALIAHEPLDDLQRADWARRLRA
jgi:hypothetical protein